jgi:hypothetical protein
LDWLQRGDEARDQPLSPSDLRVLAGAGYDCVDVVNGSDVLETAQTVCNIVILDVRLPDMSGDKVIRGVRLRVYWFAGIFIARRVWGNPLYPLSIPNNNAKAGRTVHALPGHSSHWDRPAFTAFENKRL